MKVFVRGLNSCGMRSVNIQRYRDCLVANGHELVNNPDDSDVILLWTCAFRGDVRDNSLSVIKRYAETCGDKLVVGGCLPDIDRELLRKHFRGSILS